MTSFPPPFTPRTLSIPHSLSPSLTPTTLFAQVSSPPTAAPDSPVLVFIHGYPQNHTLWAPLMRWYEEGGSEVLRKFRVVVPDLPGYGKSRKVISSDGSHLANSKREVGKDMLSLVDALFPSSPRVILIGHDRGARVAYRLAKDRPDRIIGLNVQDIVPTPVQFKRLTYDSTPRHVATFRMYHWVLLAMPSPLPEHLIFSTPEQSVWYARHSLTSWSGPAAKAVYDQELMDSWCEQYADKDVLVGALEDYRAGATIDLEHDEVDGDHILSPSSPQQPSRLSIPLLALWCPGLQATGSSIPAEQEAGGVEGIWKARGPEGEKTRAKEVETEGAGHFLPTEAKEEVGREIEKWLERWF
ncbi:Fluoroacetate dehalogenase [Rhodotorula toruloides]|nr:Fluoroacetate dehalogenase [Rhodotorula toruloides]